MEGGRDEEDSEASSAVGGGGGEDMGCWFGSAVEEVGEACEDGELGGCD